MNYCLKTKMNNLNFLFRNEKGVVHRDMAARNVLLAGQRQIEGEDDDDDGVGEAVCFKYKLFFYRSIHVLNVVLTGVD